MLICTFQESKLGHVRAQMQVSIASFCILHVPVLANADDLVVIVSLLFDTSSCSPSEKESLLLLAL